jgi:hypothetical protein
MWQDGVASWDHAANMGGGGSAYVYRAALTQQPGPCVAKVMGHYRTSPDAIKTGLRLAMQEVKLLRALQATTTHVYKTYAHSESHVLYLFFGGHVLYRGLTLGMSLCLQLTC